MEKKVLDTKWVRLELKDGILLGTYKSGPISLEGAKEIVRDRLEFTEGKAYPALINDVGLIGMERDAREYLSNEGVKGLKAGALVTNSVFSTYFANFFIRVTIVKPKIPARLFTNEDKALKWLQQYK
ncbi:MAG: STAS/SEC14 domain-containing protein [Flavobacteriales bacterium]|nr:hypothetical protein [Bacteroidales bacterium AH-315-I05]PCJ86176.1 MAG: STAS/SEC14 domain-containing protein [Flavobacteriales bacterium]